MIVCLRVDQGPKYSSGLNSIQQTNYSWDCNWVKYMYLLDYTAVVVN